MTANASRAGFAAVDEDHDAAGLVAALDEQAALPAIDRLRAAAIDRLALEPGASKRLSPNPRRHRSSASTLLCRLADV